MTNRVFLIITYRGVLGLSGLHTGALHLSLYMFNGIVGGRLFLGTEADDCGACTNIIPSLFTGFGRTLHISDTLTGKLMVWPAKAKGNTISFINACTLHINLCSIELRHASSGGTSHTRILFTEEKGGIFLFFKYTIHLDIPSPES